MPNVNDLFPSKWLKASDLKGREPVVTIIGVKYEPVGMKQEMKGVVYFKGVPKGLVLNKTNANRITQIAGSGVTEEWTGVSIKLYSTQVEYQGDLTDAIRIKPVQASKQNPLRPATEPAQTPGDAFDEAATDTANAIGDDGDIPF